MQKVIVSNKFSAWEDIYSGVPQSSILCPLLFIIPANDIFGLIPTCDICSCADINILYAYSKDFHQFEKYWKKTLRY